MVGKAEDIAELRADGGLPAHVHTVITVLPHQRVLEIQVEGLSIDADPDRTTIREVTYSLFELSVDRTSRRHADIVDGCCEPLTGRPHPP